MAELYLDHAATTPIHPEVLAEMGEVMARVYGNPSSLHARGTEAQSVLRTARHRIASVLGVRVEEVVFTSGGTESNNLAIKGAAWARRRRRPHLLTSAIEHSSVLNAMRDLAEEDFSVTYLPVDPTGRIDLDGLRRALRPDTGLISLMLVNNEVGTIQPVAEIAQKVKAVDPEILIHVDAVQGLGKVPVAPHELGVDLMTITAHKLHGPKGIGALWIRGGVRLRPLFGSGEQEGGLRSGTENVPGAHGFAVAAELAAADLPATMERLRRMRSALMEGILTKVPASVVNGPRDGDAAAPHILNMAFPGAKGEILVRTLSDAGLYVSTGSACNTRKGAGSHVLQALGLTDDLREGSLRFSLSPLLAEEAIPEAVDMVRSAVADLRALLQA